MPIPAIYPRLDDLARRAPAASAPMRVCMVAPDAPDAGVPFYRLARALAGAGHSVRMAFCQPGEPQENSGWLEACARDGIDATDLSGGEAMAVSPASPELAMSKKVYDWLKNKEEFDLILFMDRLGAGYYPMQAKACGLAFQNTALVVCAQNPSYWESEFNAAVPEDLLAATVWHIERESLAMADAVISPSQYLLAWINRRICRLPRHSYCQPDIAGEKREYGAVRDEPIREVVFYGRLDFRNGLEQFCGALDRLAKRGKLPEKVVFLGEAAWLGKDHSLLYISRRAREWQGCEVAIETGKSREEALAYLGAPGRLIVMPARAASSPAAIYDCIDAGAPFLARDSGATGEFLDAGSRERFLLGDNPAELAAKIASALGKPPERANLAFDTAENERAWLAGLPALAALARESGKKRADSPFISVILTHYNRPRFLRQAVDSLLAQDYGDFEVILADDGSDDPEALALLEELEPEFLARGWRILRLKNAFAPAARNSGARAAKGEWLLFFDDDNIAMPDMLDVCAKAAAARESGYIPIMFQVFEGDSAPAPESAGELFLPTGNQIAYSAFQNALSDTTSLIHADSFKRIGGFREDYGIGHEDYELFLRFALTGEPVAIIPEPLFWYRRYADKSSVQLNTNQALNRMRSLRPFLELLPPQLAELALISHGQAVKLRLYEDLPPEAAAQALERERPAGDTAILLQAANIIADLGQGELASQIIESLPGKREEIAFGRLANRAREAALAGAKDRIFACLGEAAEMDLAPGQMALLCAAIADNFKGDSEINAEIAKILDNLPEKDALAHLLLAEFSLPGNNAELALRQIMEALKDAESQYRQKRPDVADAIDAKVFACALQHFALHGYGDNMQWECGERFGGLLKRHPALGAPLKKLHMAEYGYKETAIANLILSALINGPNK